MRVRVVNCNRFTHRGCNGMEGEITKEFEFNGKKFFEVTATNEGEIVKDTGKKKVRSWKIGDHADFLKEEFIII